MKLTMVLFLWASVLLAFGSSSSVSMSFNDHNIHAGKHFFYHSNQDVTDADTIVRFLFVTPSERDIHARFSIEAEDEFIIELYEGATTSNNGTPITIYNNNRNSTETATVLGFSAPTVSNDGTLIWKGVVNSGKKTSLERHFNYELVAKNSTKYMFKITKTAAGTHFIEPDFYFFEHP